MQGAIEFPKGSGVRIREICNRTKGATFGSSWIVVLPGRLTGNGRERKQFQSLGLARDFAAQAVGGIRAVGQKFVELEHSDRDAAIRLLDALKARGGSPEDTVADVLAALKGLGNSPTRLADCVAFALPRLAPRSGVVSVAEAAQSLLEAKAGQVGGLYLRTLKVQLDRVIDGLGTLPISHLDAAKITAFIGGLKLKSGEPASPKFRKHVLGAVQSLVRHAVGRGWMEKGIVDFEVVETPRQSRGGAIEFFSADEIKALLTHSDEDLKPFLAIGAFAGLRSMEIERLDWAEVDLKRGHIEVRAEHAKTGARRLAACPENLKRWLAPIAKKSGRVFPISTAGGNLTMRLQALAKRAGLDGWRKNGLRHAFISHRTAILADVAAVALECGNSPQIIFSNYRAIVSREEAERYFAIAP